jgi:hypothetical protein
MHESKRVVLASKFATKENWSRTNSEQDLVRKCLRGSRNLSCNNLAFAVKLLDRQRHMLVGIGSLKDIGIFGTRVYDYKSYV